MFLNYDYVNFDLQQVLLWLYLVRRAADSSRQFHNLRHDLRLGARDSGFYWRLDLIDFPNPSLKLQALASS